MTKMLAKSSMRNALARLRRLGADTHGAGIVEFALMLPPLALFVMGVIDIGRGFASRFGLEQATQRTIELASVGTVGTNYAYLKPRGAAAAGVPENQVTVVEWLECSAPGAATGTRQTNFTDSCASGQMTARYVQVTIWRSYRPSFNYGPLGRYFAGAEADGTIRFTATSGVRVQ